MTARLLGDMKAIADRLSSVGIRSAIDPRDVNPPCVLVEAPVVRYRFGRDSAEYEWSLVLIVPNSGTAASLTLLSPMLDDVRNALAAGVEARPTSFLPLAGGDPLPAYVLTYTNTVR